MIGAVIQNIATAIATVILVILESIRYLVSLIASILLLILLSPLIVYAYVFNKQLLQANLPSQAPPPATAKLTVEEIERKFPSRLYKDVSIEEVNQLFSRVPPPPRATASVRAATPAQPQAASSTAAEIVPAPSRDPNSLLTASQTPASGQFSVPVSKQVSATSRNSASSGPTSEQTSEQVSTSSVQAKGMCECTADPELPQLALTRTMTGETLICPICLCKPEPDSRVRLLPCGHMFHCSCVDEWFTLQELICPMCRRKYCSRPTPFPIIHPDRQGHAQLVSRPP